MNLWNILEKWVEFLELFTKNFQSYFFRVIIEIV